MKRVLFPTIARFPVVTTRLMHCRFFSSEKQPNKSFFRDFRVKLPSTENFAMLRTLSDAQAKEKALLATIPFMNATQLSLAAQDAMDHQLRNRELWEAITNRLEIVHGRMSLKEISTLFTCFSKSDRVDDRFYTIIRGGILHRLDELTVTSVTAIAASLARSFRSDWELFDILMEDLLERVSNKDKHFKLTGQGLCVIAKCVSFMKPPSEVDLARAEDALKAGQPVQFRSWGMGSVEGRRSGDVSIYSEIVLRHPIVQYLERELPAHVGVDIGPRELSSLSQFISRLRPNPRESVLVEIYVDCLESMMDVRPKNEKVSRDKAVQAVADSNAKLRSAVHQSETILEFDAPQLASIAFGIANICADALTGAMEGDGDETYLSELARRSVSLHGATSLGALRRMQSTIQALWMKKGSKTDDLQLKADLFAGHAEGLVKLLVAQSRVMAAARLFVKRRPESEEWQRILLEIEGRTLTNVHEIANHLIRTSSLRALPTKSIMSAVHAMGGVHVRRERFVLALLDELQRRDTEDNPYYPPINREGADQQLIQRLCKKYKINHPTVA